MPRSIRFLSTTIAVDSHLAVIKFGSTLYGPRGCITGTMIGISAFVSRSTSGLNRRLAVRLGNNDEIKLNQ